MPQTGTVKFFNHAKGFGFITPDDGAKDVFVHISAVQASGLPGLEDGQKGSVDTEPDKRGKGANAVNLTIGWLSFPEPATGLGRYFAYALKLERGGRNEVWCAWANSRSFLMAE